MAKQRKLVKRSNRAVKTIPSGSSIRAGLALRSTGQCPVRHSKIRHVRPLDPAVCSFCAPILLVFFPFYLFLFSSRLEDDVIAKIKAPVDTMIRSATKPGGGKKFVLKCPNPERVLNIANLGAFCKAKKN